MDTLTKEYALLFNAITDAEEVLQRLREELIAVQRQAEELFLGGSAKEGPQECRER